MSEFAQYLLDLLGEIGGGRGDPADDLARFALGLVFWLLLIGSVITIRRVYPGRRRSILLVGMSIGAGRELLMLLTHSLALYEVVPASTLSPFVLPLEHALMMVARIVIAAAFLFYLLERQSTSRRYLQVCLGGATVFYLVGASLWYTMTAREPQLQFTDFIGGWLAHGWGVITMGAAIILLARSHHVRRLMHCIPFTFFFLDELLSLLNVATGGAYSTSLTPISQSFHIFALPWFGYIYWREQIDEQIRLSQKLIEAERLEVVGQMAAGIAHDFNNHLQAIVGYAQTPLEPGVDMEVVSRRFELISESVDKASTLVHRLLSFRADDTGNDIETMDLNETVQSLAPILTSLLSGNHHLTYHLDSRTVHIRADVASVEQAIINLILNARDAMPDGGEIRVSTDVVSPSDSNGDEVDSVRLSVADSGHGMDESTLKQAFVPFFTTRDVGKGTGLGLASVYNDLHRLGGKVGIDSRPGIGTTVTLNFPGPLRTASVNPRPLRAPRLRQVMDAQKNGPESRLARRLFHSAVATRPPTDECILLAEHNPAVRNTAAAQLRSAGYTVIAVANGEAAMQSMLGAAGNKVSLLMLGASMPSKGGYEAFDAIEKQHPGIPVIFLSDPSEPTPSPRTRHPHLIKPFHREQLLTRVRSTLSRSWGRATSSA